MKAKRLSFFLLLIPFTIFLFPDIARQATGQSAEKVSSLFEKFSWRSIGPAIMGGRTIDIEAVESEPWVIYAAIGPSGVWKSENNGVTWEPVFHKESTVSVGDIAIAQSNPNIVWVGTGEATCRNSVTIGDGVYKSTDGGKTWKNMGLQETRHISRIVINRGDPNIVLVAAMGHLWGPNKERGVFKTTDGGKTWKKVLYINENTGIADLAMDPSDSLILYAAAYEHRRLPYNYSSGGPSSGLYKSEDGGETWKKLTKDLPQGIIGRIGIDVSRSNPRVVYALIEHADGGIWRSENKGESWKRMCDYETYRRVNTRPFYYSQIRIEPSDDKKVYVLSTGLFVSTDMGQKFRAIGAGIHPDHHALWIDPSNPMHLIEGNDGGIDISYDGGKTWHNVQNMVLAEVYQIGYDLRKPYWVYCGLQDNGVWGGPSATLDARGIANEHWIMVGGGDGFYVQVKPDDPHTIFANSQMNGLYRYNLNILKGKTIKPLASQEKPPYRFNWNSPIHISPHDPNVVYTGGNYLFKSEDGGHSWEIISPDLTTNDPQKQLDSGGPISKENSGAEIHCTIVTISESPVAKGVIWCGTDDGNLQITRDGGKTWRNVAGNIPGLPPFTWCSRVEASHFDAGTAYAAFDGHRHDDYGTYIFKTTDFGKTWQTLKGNLPFGWVNVIREDLKNKNLLFAGTEFGIFASLDGGKSWFSLQNNLPTVAVHDIAIHPVENDLIIGTHGRGVWILDDICFLQEMSDDVLASDFYLFNIRPTQAFLISSTGEPYSKPIFSAPNPPYGMTITAYIRDNQKEKPKISIANKEGKTIFELTLSTKAGLQREVWNLKFVPETREGKKTTPAGVGLVSLPMVPPGEYSVEFSAGEKKLIKMASVNADHRFDFREEDRKAQEEALAEILLLNRKLGLAATAAKNVRRQLDSLKEELIKAGNLSPTFQDSLKKFETKFRNLELEAIPQEFALQPSREKALRGGSVTQQLLFLGMSISGYPSRPTQTEITQLGEISRYTAELVIQLNEFFNNEMPNFNQVLSENKLKPLTIPEEIKD